MDQHFLINRQWISYTISSDGFCQKPCSIRNKGLHCTCWTILETLRNACWWRTYNQRVDVATDAMLAGRLLWLAPHDASRSGNRDITTTTRKTMKQQKTSTETYRSHWKPNHAIKQPTFNITSSDSFVPCLVEKLFCMQPPKSVFTQTCSPLHCT